MINKKWISGIVAVSLVATLGTQVTIPAKAQDIAAEQENSMSEDELGYVPGEILVIYNDGVSEAEMEEKIADEGDIGQAVIETQSEDTSTIAVVELSDDTTVEQAVEAYKQDERVQTAIPNYILESYGDGTGINDALLSSQSYLQRIEAQGAWNILNKSAHEKVRVAMLDTGLDLQQDDLAGVVNQEASAQIVKRGGSLTAEPLAGDESSDGHGTHTSGIVAAQANNGAGIAGVGSAVNNSAVDLIMVDIYPTSEKKTSIDHLLTGLKYAKSQGAKVVNMSLGVNLAKDPIKEDAIDVLNQACQDLYEAGITLVCAAGNDNYNDNGTVQVIPSDFDNTISVIALDNNNNRWGSSNYGSKKDVSAPGLNIYSTLPGNKYGVLSGTSMAAPMITATVAMMYAADLDMTPDEAKQILCDTATDLGPEGKDDQTGYGILNARKAIGSVQNMNFDDVWVGLWYYTPVEFVFQSGIMTGLNQQSFGAGGEMSRAQFVTILYRMQASPYMDYLQRFPDVDNGKFYSDPVTWAASSEVVTGYENGFFGPAERITREQLALMLYRYAGYRGLDTGAVSDLSQFPDKASVSGFAADAVRWAVGTGIISGDGGRINPQGDASRAHCAQMLQRMIEHYGLD